MARSERRSTSSAGRAAAAVAPVRDVLREAAATNGLHVGDLVNRLVAATERERAAWTRLDSLAYGFAYFPEDRDGNARRARQTIPRHWAWLARRFADALARALELPNSKLRAHLERRAPAVLRRLTA